MSKIDIEQCLSTQAKKQFQRDLATYVERELRYQSEDSAHKYIQQYLKNNPDYIQSVITEVLEAQKPKLVKFMKDRMNETFRGY